MAGSEVGPPRSAQCGWGPTYVRFRWGGDGARVADMRKPFALFVSLLVVSFGLAVTASPVRAAAPVRAQAIVCASTAICFARTANDLPFVSFDQNITRNVCHNITPNITGYIDNNTPVQWKVSTAPCGSSGTVGTIFAHTEHAMTSPFLNSIDSTWRTSSP